MIRNLCRQAGVVLLGVFIALTSHSRSSPGGLECAFGFAMARLGPKGHSETCPYGGSDCLAGCIYRTFWNLGPAARLKSAVLCQTKNSAIRIRKRMTQ